MNDADADRGIAASWPFETKADAHTTTPEPEPEPRRDDPLAMWRGVLAGLVFFGACWIGLSIFINAWSTP